MIATKYTPDPQSAAPPPDQSTCAARHCHSPHRVRVCVSERSDRGEEEHLRLASVVITTDPQSILLRTLYKQSMVAKRAASAASATSTSTATQPPKRAGDDLASGRPKLSRPGPDAGRR